jgi:hypothetical protein
MDQERARIMVNEVRKRFRSSQQEESINKRQKDLTDEDLEEFLELMDKYGIEKSKSVSMQESKMADITTRKPADNNELLKAIGPMFTGLEDRLSHKIDALEEKLKFKDQIILKLEEKVDELEQITKLNCLTFHGVTETETSEEPTEKIIITRGP